MVSQVIRLVLADSCELIRDAIAARLQTNPRFEVVGTTTSSDDLVQICRRERPDVLLMDVDLPGRGTFDAADAVLHERPQTKVVLLTEHLADIFVGQALRIGAAGYLLKSETYDCLCEAIEKAVSGQTYLSPPVKDRVYFDKTESRLVPRIESDLTLLTNRQLEVLRHLARGDSVKEIAKQMHLSQKSVDSHKYRIMNKLGIHDRVELARFAIREGLMLP
ncbi:MAG TPA: response regulator transcription factor [Planctomycetaceae bacterium]|nr:response regulator transcription factor [Planctomycetaceae bacterium]